MGKRQIPPEEPAEIHEVPLRDALEERYLAYALSTIMHRALPDARDGLKPVHRRILYGMDLLGLDPRAAFKKSAKIVGDVMGSFHPHGDQAIYDAMVRLAQDFSSRYPLVDGQGNFGNIDGDNPAAYRYTEARMTEVARLLLDGIDEDGVEFRLNYDGQSKEPVVLPGGFPNLLANGAQGIAVGMATSIPPHNAAELCDAALHLIEKPDAKSKALLKWVKGPDFPTGGIVVDSKEAIVEAYTTGRGSFRTRSRWTQEEGARGTWVVVVTEIPWLVQKSRIVEKIAELINEKKLPLVADVRDESAEDVRLVIEPKSRTVDPALMMESLFRLTELESKISLNLNVLIKGRIPKVVGLAECLREWLDHLRDVLVRRSNFRRTQIEHRLEVLGGHLVAYLNLDKVIKIIRTEDEPKPVLMKTFKLSEIQADAILNMRLRNLRRLEEMEIRTEDKDLRKELKGIEGLLASETEQWAKVGDQVRKVRDIFGPKTPLGKRRTTFADAPEHDLAAIEEALVEREPCTVVISEKGWVRTLKGHVERSLGACLQDRRQARALVFCRDHLEAAAVCHQRQVLFARRGKTAGRPRPWRADPDVHRSRAGCRDHLAVRQQGRAQVPDREQRGAGLHRQGRGLRRQHPQGQAGAQRRNAERGPRDHDRERRHRRGDRHQPQDGAVRPRPGAGDGARPRRAAAEIHQRVAV
ncbi:DNA topoisomerase IV subunit A [Bradyrhizobium elkanii]